MSVMCQFPIEACQPTTGRHSPVKLSLRISLNKRRRVPVVEAGIEHRTEPSKVALRLRGSLVENCRPVETTSRVLGKPALSDSCAVFEIISETKPDDRYSEAGILVAKTQVAAAPQVHAATIIISRPATISPRDVHHRSRHPSGSPSSKRLAGSTTSPCVLTG